MYAKSYYGYKQVLYKLLANMSPLFCKCVRIWREVLGRYSVYREYDIYMAYNHNTVDLPSSLPSCYYILIYSFQICSIRLIISVLSCSPDPLNILHMSSCMFILLKYFYACRLSKSVLLISVNTFFIFFIF